jgi:hypothetical protein
LVEGGLLCFEVSNQGDAVERWSVNRLASFLKCASSSSICRMLVPRQAARIGRVPEV